MTVRDALKTKRRWDTLPAVSRASCPFGVCQHVCLLILPSILSHRAPTSSFDIEVVAVVIHVCCISAYHHKKALHYCRLLSKPALAVL